MTINSGIIRVYRTLMNIGLGQAPMKRSDKSDRVRDHPTVRIIFGAGIIDARAVALPYCCRNADRVFYK